MTTRKRLEKQHKRALFYNGAFWLVVGILVGLLLDTTI